MSRELFHVALVSPDLWRPLLQEAVAGLPERRAGFVRAVVRTSHNRHIGITPSLAASLAERVFRPAGREGERGPWPTVFRRLQRELVGDRGRGFDGHGGYGPVLTGMPAYAVLRLVLPIVERACRNLGQSFLFCEDDVPGSVPKGRYLNYAGNLDQAILALVDEEDSAWNLFWRERAISLSQLARPAPGFPSPLPEIEPTALAHFFRTKPEVPALSQREYRRRPMRSFRRLRKSPREREGGIEGIGITRRAEDMNDILLSEFMSHETLVAERLANSGYLAYKRQPKRDEMRDVHVAAVMPPCEELNPMVPFVKACWFDFAKRLGYLLYCRGLVASELGWTEGDGFGRARSRRFRLRDLGPLQHAGREIAEQEFQRLFLNAMGWLPFFLDDRSRFRPLDHGDSNGRDPDPMLQWATRAWRAGEKDLPGQRREKQEGPRFGRFSARSEAPAPRSAAAFSRIHIMVLLPVSRMDTTLPGIESALRGFGLAGHPAAFASITFVPSRPDALDGWFYQGRGGAAVPMFGPADHAADGDRIAGRVVGFWLERLMGELWRA